VINQVIHNCKLYYSVN